MGLFLGIIVIILLTGVVFVNVQAIRYYAGAYAKATRRGFMAVMRDPHAREVYRLSRRLAAWGDGDRNRLLFDVALPRDGAPTVRADVVLVSPRGLAVFCVQEGRGSAYGDVGDGHWIVVGSAKRDGSERMVPNLGARVSEAVAALRGYLLMDGTTALPVATCAVFSDAVDVDHVEVAEGVTLTHVRDIASCLDDALPVTADEEREDTAPSFDDADLKRRYRALRVCANMPDVDADGEGAILSFERSDRLEPTAWLRGVVQREHEESTVAEIVRKADRLASSKEDFDALTWERVLEISNQMESGGDSDRIGELAGELRLIARTNISLNYRFGIAQADGTTRLSPAGLAVESDVGTLSATAPDAPMHEALEDTEFFGDTLGDDNGGDGLEGSEDER